MPVKIKQLKEKGTGTPFVPVTHWDAVSNKPNASQSTSGLMSATDKTKLDGLGNYTLPAATAQALGGIKVGSGLSVDNDGTVSVDTRTITEQEESEEGSTTTETQIVRVKVHKKTQNDPPAIYNNDILGNGEDDFTHTARIFISIDKPGLVTTDTWVVFCRHNLRKKRKTMMIGGKKEEYAIMPINLYNFMVDEGVYMTQMNQTSYMELPYTVKDLLMNGFAGNTNALFVDFYNGTNGRYDSRTRYYRRRIHTYGKCKRSDSFSTQFELQVVRGRFYNGTQGRGVAFSGGDVLPEYAKTGMLRVTQVIATVPIYAYVWMTEDEDNYYVTLHFGGSAVERARRYHRNFSSLNKNG